MAYQRQGFNVADFISPFRGDPIGAQKLSAEVSRGAAQDAGQNMALMTAQQRARMQADLERQAMEQRAATAYMQQQHANARTRAVVDQRAEAARLKLEREQAVAGGELAGEAAKAFAAGDENALIGIKSQALSLDPMLQITLPGQAPTPRVDPNLPSVDEVYPNDPNALTIERGGQQLYGETRDAARQREQAIVKRLHPLLKNSPFGSEYAPAVAAAESMAGAGMSGADARKFAIDHGRFEVGQFGAQRRADTMAGQRMGQLEDQKRFRLHSAIQGVKNDVAKLYDIDGLAEDDKKLSNIARQLSSGDAWQQNRGLMEEVARISGKAMTEREFQLVESSQGKWAQLNNNVNRYLQGGQLDPGFWENVRDSTLELMEANKRIRLKAAMAGRDAMYSASELPFDSAEELVRAGNQVFGQVAGKYLTPEQMAQEVARIQKLFPGRFSGVSAPPASSSPGGMPPVPDAGYMGPMGGSGAAGNLGDTDGARGKKLIDVNDEADELLGEED